MADFCQRLKKYLDLDILKAPFHFLIDFKRFAWRQETATKQHTPDPSDSLNV
jgi:hypothetical protein